jgi:membrane protease YdiL (CAAX protease family)
MTELPEDGARAEPEARPPSAFLSLRVTAACTALAVLLVTVFVGFYPSGPLEQLQFPEESLERLVSRELDLRAAARRAPSWERALHAFLGAYQESLDEPIRRYEELAEATESASADLHRMILVAEAARQEGAPASPSLADQPAGGEPGGRMAAWIQGAYSSEALDSGTGRILIAQLREDLPESWFADVLVAQIAARIGDAATEGEARSAILGRGEALLWRWRAVLGAEAILLFLAAIVLVQMLRGRFPLQLSAAPLPPPWPGLDGYGLFIRGVLGFLLVSAPLLFLLPHDNPLIGVFTLLAGLPLLWWTRRYLAARGLTAASTFGLAPPQGGAARLAGVTVALIGLSMVGEAAIAAAMEALRFESHWAEGLSEEVLWGPAWLTAAETMDSAVWTPIVEELAFRGLLFGALRTRLALWPAALLSAAVFAVAHGYSPIGFAAVLWSGVLWAVAYERTGSLVPGILAHAVNNLLVSLTQLLLLRL